MQGDLPVITTEAETYKRFWDEPPHGKAKLQHTKLGHFWVSKTLTNVLQAAEFDSIAVFEIAGEPRQAMDTNLRRLRAETW
jgi:hypothetical protein